MELNDDGASLVDGFVARVPGEHHTARAVNFFRQTAGQDRAELRVSAVFPESEGGNPLEWRFRLDSESKADERIRHVVENCGGVLVGAARRTPLERYGITGEAHPDTCWCLALSVSWWRVCTC